MKLKITAGPFIFEARLEAEAAPKTCAAFSNRLPFESQLVHVRWSGEAVWIPLGEASDCDAAVAGRIPVAISSWAGRAGLGQGPGRGELLLRGARHHQCIGLGRGPHPVECRVRNVEQQAPR